MKPVLIYATAASREEALAIGRTLVEERLAACINVLGPIESIYRWEGSIETSSEIAFLAKTREALADAVIARIAELHSYDCPCAVALPIEHIHEPFSQWLEEQL
jgi:periplasmic divalent cation tolerance protein